MFYLQPRWCCKTDRTWCVVSQWYRRATQGREHPSRWRWASRANLLCAWRHSWEACTVVCLVYCVVVPPTPSGHRDDVRSLRHQGSRRFLQVLRTSQQQLLALKLFFFPLFSPPQLPLLKALIDRLLQGGVEELLQVLGRAKDDVGADDTGHVVRKSTTTSEALLSQFGHRQRPPCHRRKIWFFCLFVWELGHQTVKSDVSRQLLQSEHDSPGEATPAGGRLPVSALSQRK